MWRLLGTLACIVAVVWVLSLFAIPAMPEVEGHDITMPDPPRAVAKAFPLAGPDPVPEDKAEPEKTKIVEKKAKGKKGGKGEEERRPLASGLLTS